MSKIVSASEAKNKFSALVQWATKHQDDVIVQSHGQPKAVIMSYVEYEALVALKEDARRQEALRRLEEIAGRIQALNQDLSEEEAESLASKLSRETIERMEKKGQVQFQS